MRPEDTVRITHMMDAAGSVARFVAGRHRDEIDTDEMLRFALVRAIEIIGEAASKVSHKTQGDHPEIPWQLIIGMRNRLVHAYFDVDGDVLWAAATIEVPTLLSALQAVSLEE